MAHEIKNPLQAITVHLEVLKSKLADQYDHVGAEIETIAREILRLDRVVKTFLDFTRPVDLKMRDIEMVALARDVVALVGPSVGRQNVSIELDAGGEIFLRGDRDLLQQAVLNVVNNGVEAMKSGGRLLVRVSARGRRVLPGHLRRGGRCSARNPGQDLQSVLQHQGERFGNRISDGVPYRAIA